MKVTFVISCHDRITDLLCHLDVLSFYNFPHAVRVIYSGSEPLSVPHTPVAAIGHNSTVLSCVKEGLRVCGGGLMIYRNADDIIYRPEWVKSNIERFNKGNYLFAGYSWWGVGGRNDYTLQECMFDVAHFLPHEWTIPPDNTIVNAEQPLADYVNPLVPDNRFMRLEGREVPSPGIGSEYVGIKGNSRFYNQEWGLIGAHDDRTRLHYYNLLRPYIPFWRELESKPNFAKWLKEARGQ